MKIRVNNLGLQIKIVKVSLLFILNNLLNIWIFPFRWQRNFLCCVSFKGCIDFLLIDALIGLNEYQPKSNWVFFFLITLLKKVHQIYPKWDDVLIYNHIPWMTCWVNMWFVVLCVESIIENKCPCFTNDLWSHKLKHCIIRDGWRV